MCRSSSYAGERTKSVFVEMSERSADTARLLQQAAEPASSARRARSWVVRIMPELIHVLAGLGKRVARPRGDVHLHVPSSSPNRGK